MRIIILCLFFLSSSFVLKSQNILPLQSRVDLLTAFEDRDKVYIIGDGNLSSSGNFDLNALSSKVSLYYLPHKRITTFISINRSVVDFKSNADSLKLKNVLGFPENSNLGFLLNFTWKHMMISPNGSNGLFDSKGNLKKFSDSEKVNAKQFRYIGSEWNSFAEFGVQNRSIDRKDVNYKFDLIGLTIGTMYSWLYYGAQNIKVIASGNIGLQYVARGKDDFRSFFNSQDLSQHYYTFGAKATIQLNALTFSYEAKYILPNTGSLPDEQSKGILFEAKVVIGGNIISF